jgi:cytochrome b561/polyisoprenoid-binding protein YceI
MQREDYTGTAKALHWLTAALIFIQFPLGWVMDDFSGVQKIQAYNYHKSIGLTVLALVSLRLVWRLFHPAPGLPRSMPKIERILAHLGHAALFAAIIGVTLAGWALISASKFPSSFFQLAPIPKLPWLSDLPSGEQKAYKDMFETIHIGLGFALLALIAVHLAAVFRHALVLKDGIVSRMLPRFARSAGPVAVLVFGASLFSLAGAESARAMEWGVIPDKSEVDFEANGGGYNTKGSIKNYKAEVEFDPDTPEQTSVRVILDMKTATTGTPDVDQTLQSEDFFNPGRFPTAEFAARGAKPDGDGRYILDGRLTLKGVTKPLTLPFSIDIVSGTAAVRSEVSINRLDFGVGPETVAGFAVDNEVKLTIDLTAMRLDN